jgi:hypothetical protein
MIGRRTLMVGALAAAVGGPYMAHNVDWDNPLSGDWGGWFGSDEAPAEVVMPNQGDRKIQALLSETQLRPDAPPLVGDPVTRLDEVIRFDVSPEWVYNRWARVTTNLSEIQYEGLRVPLVTGTKVGDVAGSLTYYFDGKQQVQRITLEGVTGDSTKLIQLVTQGYEFEREDALGGSVFTTRWNGEPTGALVVKRAPIIRAQARDSQLQVILEINRPTRKYSLSPRMADLLKQQKQVGLR